MQNVVSIIQIVGNYLNDTFYFSDIFVNVKQFPIANS